MIENLDSLPPIFSREAAIAAWAEKRATEPVASSDALQRDFATLTRYYTQLLRQSAKIVTVIDATQRQLLQTSQELRETVQRMEKLATNLQQLNLEQEEILHLTTHDLKSPLAALYSYAEVLLSETSTGEEEWRTFGLTVRDSLSSSLGMISDMLDLYRMEQSLEELTLSPLTAGELISHIVRDFSTVAQQKGIALSCDVLDREVRLLTDVPKLVRIANNLVSNAIKYSPPGQSVVITFSHSSSTGRFIVTDQGPGIAEADLPKLFKKFGRTKNQPTAGESSSGLGLAIAKKLADLLQGHLSVESEVGRGSRFILEIPLQLAER